MLFIEDIVGVSSVFSGKDRSNHKLRNLIVLSPLALAMGAAAEVENAIPPEAEIATVTTVDKENPLQSTITYPASYFSHYDPVTALDILNRIPGIDSVLSSGGGGGRGLGAGDSPILIDGKRIAGKSNSGSDVLGRIAAKQIEHVEIIRGSSADLDVRTAGPIVNIVMKEGASRSSVSVEANAIGYGGEVHPGGSISAGGQSGSLNYLASLTVNPYFEQQRLEEISTNADGSIKDVMVQTRTREQTDYELAGNFGYSISPQDLLQFNAFFRENSNPHVIDRSRTLGNGLQNLEREDRESERSKWEIGGNYQRNFGDGDRFNLIFVINDRTDDWFYDRFALEGNSASKTLYIGEDQRDRERILRSSFNFGLADGQDIEAGVEGAQTILDKSFRLGSAKAGVASARFGGLVPGSDVVSTVEEIRFEPFVIHNWQLSPVAALESTLVAEFSEISQNGTNNGRAVAKSREFEFLKPKLDYRYDLTQSTQLRTTIERYVSQLSFSNFTASSNGDLDKNVNAGNPDLEQQKSWRYEFNLEHRLPEDTGVLNTRVFYHDIEDVIDRVDVSSSPAALVSAPGNIGHGERYGLELDASVRLAALEMPDALLTVGALVQDSEVMDPFTEEYRRLKDEGRGKFSLGFRHDVPALGLNYGADYTYFFQGEEMEVDIEDTQERFRPANTSLFVEKVAFRGVTFRLESFNLFEADSCYERTRFLGPTAGGIVEEVEDRCFSYGRKVKLSIKTTF
ncbi:TonB-dependent receptor [Proteobacteria bacterium 005FR1]|nr:TonB-dependent receptor [Proteobacteria bacterium 005FR1]